MRIAGWLAGAALTTLVAGGRAVAEPAADPRIAKADELFTQGRALLAVNLEQACAKFKESLDYNPAAIGTLLNAALCDEKLGRVASAVAKFSEARDRAKEQGLAEHIRAAEERIVALEPSIPHVAITLTERLPETKIVIDDKLVAIGAIANVAVDPGEIVIVVSAPARLPYRVKLVFAPAEHKDITIPALAKSVTVTSSQLRIGQIATIAGGAAAGAGLGIGLYARHQFRQQFDDGHCTSDPVKGDRCTAEGQTQTRRAHTLGNVGTVVGLAGLAVAGVGAYLWIRAPVSTSNDTSDPKLAVVPQVGSDRLGIVALGRF